jgi:hypothetical protein
MKMILQEKFISFVSRDNKMTEKIKMAINKQNIVEGDFSKTKI